MDKKDLAYASLKSIGFVNALVVKKHSEAAKKLEISSKAALGITSQIVKLIPGFTSAPDEQVVNNIKPAQPVSTTTVGEANVEFRKSVRTFFNPKDWILGLVAALPFLLNKQVLSNIKTYFESILENLGVGEKARERFIGLIKGAAAIVLGVFAVSKLTQMAKVFKSMVVLANAIATAITILAQAIGLLNFKGPSASTKGADKATPPSTGKGDKEKQSRPTGPVVSSTGAMRQAPLPPPAQINKAPPSAAALKKGVGPAEVQRRQLQSSAAKAASAQIQGNQKVYGDLFGKKQPNVTPQNAAATAETVKKAAPKLIDRLGAGLGNVMVGAGAALSAYDAYSRLQGEDKDYVGAGISGTAAALQGAGLAMTLTGVGAPIGAAMIGIGAGLSWIGFARDIYKLVKSDEEKIPGEDLKVTKEQDLKANVVRSEVTKGDDVSNASNAVVLYKRAMRRKTVNVNQNVDNTLIVNQVIPPVPAPISYSGSVGR